MATAATSSSNNCCSLITQQQQTIHACSTESYGLNYIAAVHVSSLQILLATSESAPVSIVGRECSTHIHMHGCGVCACVCVCVHVHVICCIFHICHDLYTVLFRSVVHRLTEIGVTTITFNQVCDQTVFAQVHSDTVQCTVVLCSAEHTNTPQPCKYYMWLQPISYSTGQLT